MKHMLYKPVSRKSEGHQKVQAYFTEFCAWSECWTCGGGCGGCEGQCGGCGGNCSISCDFQGSGFTGPKDPFHF